MFEQNTVKMLLTKANINFHIFNLALHWQSSLLRTTRGTLFAILILNDSERLMKNNFKYFSIWISDQHKN
jgi:hypothetical protein